MEILKEENEDIFHKHYNEVYYEPFVNKNNNKNSNLINQNPKIKTKTPKSFNSSSSSFYSTSNFGNQTTTLTSITAKDLRRVRESTKSYETNRNKTFKQLTGTLPIDHQFTSNDNTSSLITTTTTTTTNNLFNSDSAATTKNSNLKSLKILKKKLNQKVGNNNKLFDTSTLSINQQSTDTMPNQPLNSNQQNSTKIKKKKKIKKLKKLKKISNSNTSIVNSNDNDNEFDQDSTNNHQTNPQLNESLRWQNVLLDPLAEADRIDIYKQVKFYYYFQLLILIYII
jgi:hypothetical protein